MIAVIGAMVEEINPFKELIDDIDEVVISGVHFYTGTYKGKKVVLMLSGIGKINAAVNTTVMFENFDITHVINIGTAGGIGSELKFGDIVVSDSVVNHDVDITGFGREMGELPDQPIYFESHKELIDIVVSIREKLSTNVHLGLIATGDQFVHTKEGLERIVKHFPKTVAVEMEAYAVARVCYKYNVPFIVARSISDLVFLESGYDFKTYLDIASKNSTIMLTNLIEAIEVK